MLCSGFEQGDDRIVSKETRNRNDLYHEVTVGMYLA